MKPRKLLFERCTDCDGPLNARATRQMREGRCASCLAIRAARRGDFNNRPDDYDADPSAEGARARGEA